ncbi:hypothetical protein Ddc_05408 [Ditylenchus destructor]|nr:hypothetical protein Ddc_05408 [Ditylenchus destructor]
MMTTHKFRLVSRYHTADIFGFSTRSRPESKKDRQCQRHRQLSRAGNFDAPGGWQAPPFWLLIPDRSLLGGFSLPPIFCYHLGDPA